MRRWRDSDRELYAAMNADPQVMRYFPSTLSRAESDAHVDRIEQRFETEGTGLWALEVPGKAEFIGFTGLNAMPAGVPGTGGTEVGWRLTTTAWGHGYATEAARAALGVAFGELGLPEIWSMTAVLNVPSQAVMHRIGMTACGHFEHPAVPAGHPARPHVLYRIARPG